MITLTHDHKKQQDTHLIQANKSSPITFSQAVFTLLSGGIIAQILPYLATLFLARLYTPAEFGALALFTAISSAAAIVATGRYELAIPLAKKESDANALVIVAGTIALSSAVILGLLTFYLSTHPFDHSSWKTTLLFLPVAVLSTASYQICTYWFLRHALYRQITTTRLVQAGSTVLISFTLGWYGYAIGMIIGYFTGWMIAAIFCIVLIKNTARFNGINSIGQLKRNAVHFYHHALYGALPALLDSISVFSIIFIVNHHYGHTLTGEYTLSRQIAYGPASLIAGVIGQVIFKESAQLLRKKQSDKALFKKITLYLSCMAIPYTLLLLFIAPTVFPRLFGAPWISAGFLTSILAVSYGIRLLVSTLSSFLLAHNALRWNGLWQGFYFIVINLLYFFHPANATYFFLSLTLIDGLLFSVYFFIIRTVIYRNSFTVNLT